MYASQIIKLTQKIINTEMKQRILLCAFLAILLSVLSITGIAHTSCSMENDMTTTVSWVIDGDTFDTTSGNRIRLADIDAPEEEESGYDDAKSFLIDLVYNKTVHLDIDDVYGTDKWDRLVCVVYVSYNSTHYENVNKALLVNGFAVIDNYDNEFSPYEWRLYCPKEGEPFDPVPLPEPLEVDWWPMFQHDPAHTGYSSSKVPEANDTLWVCDIGQVVSVGVAPAIADDRVFIGSAGEVYCVNSSSGLLLWRYEKPYIDSSTSPAVSNGRLFIGLGREEIVCLNATNGDLIWNFTSESQIRKSSPVTVNGRVFIGSGWDHILYCLSETNGSLLWKYTMGYDVCSSPTVVEDRVFVGSNDGNFHCLNATAGTHVWSYPLNASMGGSAAYSDGRIFIGTRGGDSRLYCLNGTTGERIWDFEAEGQILATPAITKEKVFIGLDSPYVYCLSASNGSLIWRCNTGVYGTFSSSPAIADGKIVVSIGRELHVLNETNGETIWSYNPPQRWVRSKGFSEVSAAIAQGRIFIASQDNELYCFGPMLYYYITVSLTFYDNRGEHLSPSPSSWTVLFPNGTRKSASSIETYFGPMGTYSVVNVNWKGYEVLREATPIFLDSNTTWNPRVDCILPAPLSLSLNSSTSYLGWKVVVNGNLTCNEVGVSKASILLSYSVTNGETWNEIMQVDTDSDGAYSAAWIPSATGNYIVRAEWEGNFTFPTTTTLINLAVTSFEEQSVFSVTSNSTMTNLTFNSTSKELTFIVIGPTGTPGVAEVYIPESLVANIADVRVFLDDGQIGYKAISVDDSWLLHFTYLHSTHEITISLGDISSPFTDLILEAVLYGLPIVAVAILVVFYVAKRKKRRDSG